jgi:hypothetical protein
MPVYITDSDALTRLAQIEGEPWRDLQEAEPDRPLGFFQFKRAYESIKQIYADLKDEDRRETMRNIGITCNGNPAIYGEGGWNRYFIRWSGEIVISVHHVRLPKEKWLAKAAEVGVRTSSEVPR